MGTFIFMFHRLIHFFDLLEDHVRHRLSKHPVLYAFIGGFAVVLFWRGVWTFADNFSFMTPVVSIIISVALMLLTGTFVSFFIGEQILMSGLKEEKRVDQKTEEDLKKEGVKIESVFREIGEMRREITRLREILEKRQGQASKRRKNRA